MVLALLVMELLVELLTVVLVMVITVIIIAVMVIMPTMLVLIVLRGEGASMFSLLRYRHLKGRDFWPGDVRDIQPGPAVRTGTPR